MASVHVDTFKGGPLARGMSFPVRTGMIVPLFEQRKETDIYLKLWYCDDVKTWAKRGATERLKWHAPLLDVRFDRSQNEWRRKRNSWPYWRNPALEHEIDPCIVDVWVHSLPASILKDSTLTRERLAAILPGHLDELFPRHINGQSVRLSYVLNAPKKQLSVEYETKPVREWERVRSISVNLEND